MSMKTIFRTTLLHTLAMLPLTAFCLHGQADANETTKSAGKYEGASLCDAGDEVYNSCITNTGKNLSICTTKQNPATAYIVYGTPENISLASPKTGEFPLKYISLKPGHVFYFTENGKQHIAYMVYEDTDDGKGRPLEGDGLITRDASNHQIISRDFCVKETLATSEFNRITDYTDREDKDTLHISDINKIMTPELQKTLYDHFHREE